MRCPYCGVTNGEQARFCVHCGRDMTTGRPGPGVRQQSPYTPQPSSGQRPPSSSTVTPQQPPYQPSQPPQPAQGRGAPTTRPPQTQTPQTSQPPRVRPQSVPVPAPMPEPDAPAPFPPKNVEQLNALEQGALAYNVLDTTVNAQWKKTVRIVFPRCTAWQQAATLLKALKDQLNTNHETIVIQGLQPQDTDIYGFTNGQLTFDRHARLGGQTMARYLLETNDGYASDSVRVVLMV